MTDTNQLPPSEREAFEAFAQNCPMGKYSIARRGYGYDSSHTQLMWDVWQARAQVQGEPIGQVFYAADGGDDETGAGYYMEACVHWFGKAPAADTPLYTTPQPAQATQAEVTDGFVLVNRGTIESAMQHVPYRGEVWQELNAATLALRPAAVPMTDEQLNDLIPSPYVRGVYMGYSRSDICKLSRAIEAHHGIKAHD